MAFAPKNYSTGTPDLLRIYYRADGGSTWNVLATTANVNDSYPQISWDGTSFYLFRRAYIAANDYQIFGQRGIIGLGSTPSLAEAQRPWVNEGATSDRNITWFEVPRRIGAEAIPFFYLRHRSGGTDDISVNVERIAVVGDRAGWEYREFIVPGAGVMKVNLANGNLHYRMTDALFPARQWNDEIARAYDSWATEPDQGMHLLGKGWSASFQPRIELTGDPNRVNYLSGDGARYAYMLSGSTWEPELGMHAELTKPNSDPSRVWKLKDVHGNTLYFDGNGRPTRKEDSKTTPSTQVWDNSNTGSRISTLTGSTGRVQEFTLDGAGHVTKIRIKNPAPNDNVYLDYEYAYDSNGLLISATLATNTTDFAGSDPAKRVRISYAYDSSQRLNQITTPEGNVYRVGYDTYGRVAWVDLPNPSTGATSTCGQTHCWQFSYWSGLGKTVIADPGGHSWTTYAYGSGQVYEIVDPQGNTAKRAWTVHRNLASETDQANKTVKYEYDIKGNRTKIEDPVNGPSKPTTFGFDSESRRTSRTDPRGHVTTYTYNSDGLLHTETDPEGGVVTFTYDASGNLTQTTNPRSYSTQLTYDGHGQVFSEIHPDGTTAWTVRDLWGRIVEKRVGSTGGGWQPSNRSTTTSYDGLGRVTSTRVRMGSDASFDDAADLVASQTYDRDGHVITKTDPNGSVTNIALDRRGRVTAVEGPPGNWAGGPQHRPCAVSEYDERSLVVVARTAATRTFGSTCSVGSGGVTWNTVQRQYDTRGLLVQEYLANLDPAEYSGTIISRSWVYDAAGRVTQATDPEGRYETFTYDDVGRKMTRTSAVTLAGVSGPGCHGISGAVCATWTWEYDEVGNVTKEKIPTGQGSSQGEVTRTATYDKVQRLKTQTDELNRTWSFTYDANGNRLTATDPLNRTTSWAYDGGDRATSVTNPLNLTTTSTYNVWDEVTAVTDANTHTTQYAYDRAGRMVSVTDPLNQTAYLQYDKNGNRTALTDPRGKVQTVTYDPLNRPITSQSAAATATLCTPSCTTTTAVRTAHAGYTLDGLVSSESDFNGQWRSYQYDSARRLKLIDHAGSTPDVGYGWNKSGQRLAMWENGVLTASYTYDEWGRLRTESRSSTGGVSYTYDRRHQLNISYPDGKTITYGYDAAGQLSYTDDWRGSVSGRTSYTYDAAGRRTARSLPNGVGTSWTYDAADRLTQVEHSQSSVTLFRATATYDNVGRRLSQTDYDPAQVTGSLPGGAPNLLAPSRTATGGSGTPNLLAGNRITGTPVPGSPNSLASRSGGLPATTVQTFQYDAAGRLTYETRTGVADTY